MSADGSTKSVLAALGANLGVAVSKFVAFAFTGSSSMLAEGVHSVADSGNQILLLFGGHRAKRRPTAAHPFGFGRERYVSAFLVSVVLFTLGGLFALYEGVEKVIHPHELDTWYWAVGVLVVAILLEGLSFRTAMNQSRLSRGRLSWWAFIRRTKAPELPVVLLEDSGALVGLVFALFGVGLSVITDNGVFDGIGTLGIGALLVCIAVILAIETKSLLIGEAAAPQEIAAIEAALVADDRIERVIHLRTLHLAPDELLVAAKIAVRRDERADVVAQAIDEAEVRVRDAVPVAKTIYIEPDIDRRPSVRGVTRFAPGRAVRPHRGGDDRSAPDSATRDSATRDSAPRDSAPQEKTHDAQAQDSGVDGSAP